MKNLRNKNAPPNADLVQVYLQSSWDVVRTVYDNLDALQILADAYDAGDLTGYLQIADIDTIAELSALITDATLGDFASQAEAEAGTSNAKTMTPLRVAQAIAVLSSGLQNKYDGTTAPTVTDDTNAGYSVGSYWIDIVASPHETYRCTDNSAGAAVWIHTTLSADELATVALTGDSDDLIEGAAQLLMTVAERSKLAAIEASATADMTGAEIKVAYEGESNTNAFNDTEKSKLGVVETGATADQTDTEIKTAYQTAVPLISQGDAEAGVATAIESFSALRVAQAIAALGGSGGGMTWLLKTAGYTSNDGEATVFHSLSASAQAGMPAAVVGAVFLVFNNDDASNVLMQTSIGGKINVQGSLAAETITLAPGEGGWFMCSDDGSPDVWEAVLFNQATGGGGGGLTPVFKSASFTAVAGEKYYVDSSGGAIVVTLPAGSDTDNIVIADIGHSAGTNNITINPNGAETIDDTSTFIIDQNEGDVDIAYDNGNTNWQVSSDGTQELQPGFSGVNDQTGTTYEFVATDLTDGVVANNAAASVYDIPDSLGGAGDTITVYNKGAGVVTIEMAGTDTLDTSDNSCAQGKAVTCFKIAATVWAVIGGSA